MVAMLPPPGDDKAATSNADIVREALDRFDACKAWQGKQDEQARDDIKFANGDARNMWQWPQNILDGRQSGDRELPCLTINSTRVHNDIIINDMSKTDYGVKVRPTGGKASYKSAEMMQTLIRRTQSISNFSSQRRKVTEQQVDGGIGYMLIETRFVSERSFDQDVYLYASRDPTAVYLDPWITEPNGSDARFGMIFEKMPRKEFNRKYPKWKDKVGKAPLGTTESGWVTDKDITLVKYYRKKSVDDTLVGFKDPDTGADVEKLASEIREQSGDEIYDALMLDIEEGRVDGRTRKVSNDAVEWFLIAGDQIVERGDWAGKYIPICRCVGRELVIDASLDRKGHTRPMIDAQRMLNYNASTAVQTVALQPKTPWLAPAESIEGHEGWKTANIDDFAVLVYSHVDDEGNELPPPQRINPPTPSPATQQGMQDAERQLMMISGQFQAQMGENDTQSAASGKAINERQAQGDTATYHFVEHQSDMLRFIGVQLLDLYPKIYDTRRALHVMGEDGEKSWIMIQPDQQTAVQEVDEMNDMEEAVKIAFNPSIGEYECDSDPGPDFATQRQEAWNATTGILQQNAALAGVVGDLLFKYGDFPGSDDIADRLQKEIKATKPYLFADNAEPQFVAAQQQIQKLTALNAEMMQKMAMLQLALKGKDERRDVEASKAETGRLKVIVDYITNNVLTEKDRAQLEHQIVSRSHDATLDMIVEANRAQIAGNEPDADPDNASPVDSDEPPIPGAERGGDGAWYLRHGGGQDVHLRVDRSA